MSDEQTPTSTEAPQGVEPVAPEAPAVESEPAPAETPEAPVAPDVPAESDIAKVVADIPHEDLPKAIEAFDDVVEAVADRFVEAVVERTHHLGVSLLHEHSRYEEIPASETQGQRIVQHVGR